MKISENLNLNSILQRLLWYYSMSVCENKCLKIAWKKGDEKKKFDPSTRIFNNFQVKGVKKPKQDQTAH